MDFLIAAGKALLIAFAVAGVAYPLFVERRNYQFVWQVFKRFRFGLFAQALGVLMVIAVVGVTLSISIPFLKYGWPNLFFDVGGNFLITPISDGSKSSSQFVRFLPILFFVALIFVLPFIAKFEEEMFRKGHEKWRTIPWQSVKFGLVHCLVGVSLAFGIALILAGLFFGQKYKSAFDRNVQTLGYRRAQEEAIMASTVAHTMYNMIVVTVLLALALVAL